MNDWAEPNSSVANVLDRCWILQTWTVSPTAQQQCAGMFPHANMAARGKDDVLLVGARGVCATTEAKGMSQHIPSRSVNSSTSSSGRSVPVVARWRRRQKSRWRIVVTCHSEVIHFVALVVHCVTGTESCLADLEVVCETVCAVHTVRRSIQ